jgi:hypothetical protein
MTRAAVLFLVACGLLITLAACGRSWFEERAPWRHDAEVACLRSGALKEGAGIVALRPIDGPGMCGADFPLRVSALGAPVPLSFADELEPPGLIGHPSPRASDPPAPGMGPREQAGPPQPVPAASSPPGPPTPLASPLASSGTAAVTPPATLACPVVSALEGWVANGVEPAAMRWFGQPVIEIKQISAYSCRSMNGQPGAPISEHAFGNALDIAGFTLADGRKVTVRDGWHGSPAERAFLHDAQAAACQLFSTVLAPGSNLFHTDHIHVDLARHASGRNICKPAPIAGDLFARGADPAPTGATPLWPQARSPRQADRLESEDE